VLRRSSDGLLGRIDGTCFVRVLQPRARSVVEGSTARGLRERPGADDAEQGQQREHHPHGHTSERGGENGRDEGRYGAADDAAEVVAGACSRVPVPGGEELGEERADGPVGGGVGSGWELSRAIVAWSRRVRVN
jgi:hypothetical protein